MTDPLDLDQIRSAEQQALARQRLGVSPTPNVGTVVTATDETGDTQVLVDGPLTSGDAEDDENGTTDLPIVARCWGRPVALGERVNLLSMGGTTYLVGSTNGQPGVIGSASIEGGAADVAIVSVVQVPVTDLTAEAEVLYPGHLIRLDVNIHLSSGGANNTLTGRIIRTDSAGTDVEVARFLRSSQMGSGETIQAGVPCYDYAPEPDVYEYVPTIQASVTGFSVILDPATTPLTAASLVVTDCGPVPISAVRT